MKRHIRTLNYVKLNKIVLFKEATLPLNHKGVTVIRGINKDADKRNTEDNTNASGKSLLVSAISQVIRSSDPVTQHIKTRAKKDFFTEKDSSIEVSTTHKKDTTIITKKAKGSSYEYSIVENGKDTNARGIAYAEQKIANLFPYSDDEYYTLYHVDSRRPNALQFGSPVQRLEFFTNLFRLSNYDDVKKLFNGVLSDMRKDSVTLEEIRRNISETEEKIGSVNIRKLKDKLKNYLHLQNTLGKDFHKLYERKQELSILSNNLPLIERFKLLNKKLGKKFTSEKEVMAFKKKVEAAIEEYESSKKQQEKYNKYLAEKKHYEREKEKLEKQLKKLKGVEEVDSKEISELKDKIAELSAKTKVTFDSADDYDVKKLKTLCKQLEVSSESSVKKMREKVLAKLNDSGADIRSLEKDVDEFKQIGKHSECPTCKQSIDVKSIKRIIAEREEKIAALNKKRKAYEKELELCNDAIEQFELKEKAEAAKENAEAVEKAKSKLKVAQKKLAKLESAAEEYAEFSKVKKALKNLEAPEKPKVQKVTHDEKRIAVYRKWMACVDIVLPLFDRLSTDTENVKEELNQLDKQLKEVKGKLDDCNSKIPELSSKKKLYESNSETLDTLRKRAEELESTVKDIPLIDWLIEAYSNKGVKLMVIKQIANIIERNMNKFAPLIYKEKIKFTFDVSVNRFDILMERNYRGKKRISDVRRLSGAESRAFSFLLPLAILPLIPIERRLNIMILDEPTVNLDYSTRNLFTTSFIPKLNSVIPHIIIVTPLDDVYKNQRTFVVEKEGGWSTLKCLS